MEERTHRKTQVSMCDTEGQETEKEELQSFFSSSELMYLCVHIFVCMSSV